MPTVPQLSERAAEAMAPEQATALVHVLDLQAQWENYCNAQKGALTHTDLQTRQKAHNSFQVAWRNYSAEYHKATLSAPSQYIVDRMVIWCRTIRTVFRRATEGSPVEMMLKVYRVADLIAVRLGKDAVARTPALDLPAAVRELDVIIAWCDVLVPPTLPGLRRKPGDAA
jgi:hypothetical protein